MQNPTNTITINSNYIEGTITMLDLQRSSLCTVFDQFTEEFKQPEVRKRGYLSWPPRVRCNFGPNDLTDGE